MTWVTISFLWNSKGRNYLRQLKKNTALKMFLKSPKQIALLEFRGISIRSFSVLSVNHMLCLSIAAALASSLQFSCENCGEEFESRIAAQTHRQYVCKRSDETGGGHTDSVRLLQDLGDRYQTASPFLNIKTERSVSWHFVLHCWECMLCGGWLSCILSTW